MRRCNVYSHYAFLLTDAQDSSVPPLRITHASVAHLCKRHAEAGAPTRLEHICCGKPHKMAAYRACSRELDLLQMLHLALHQREQR